LQRASALNAGPGTVTVDGTPRLDQITLKPCDEARMFLDNPAKGKSSKRRGQDNVESPP